MEISNSLKVCWAKYFAKGDNYTSITYPLTVTSVFCLNIALISTYNEMNVITASQVWISEYTTSTATIGNDWNDGYVFCLVLGT